MNIQERQAHILHHRVAAKRCQSNQADRMIKRRRLALVPADIGNTVTIPIPSVDRGREDPRNLKSAKLWKKTKKGNCTKSQLVTSYLLHNL